jgi:hypothetical protein
MNFLPLQSIEQHRIDRQQIGCQIMELVHCIYCSASSNPNLGSADLNSLLAKARATNAKIGVTGILLFHRGSFFQVLEGERDVVEGLYKSISSDKRHTRITKILQESIPHRNFEDWTMGYPQATQQEIENIPGLNDVFKNGRTYIDVCESKARLLLGAFMEGRWHAALGAIGCI